MTLDSNEIMKVLPHRFPFQLVDRITACEPGVRAEGRTVSYTHLTLPTT